MTTEILLSIKSAIATIIKDTKWEKHVYLVGGCVRDLILHRSIHDIDIAVDIKDGGIEFVKWLEKHFFTASKTTAVLYQHWGSAKFSLRCFPEYVIDCSQTRNDNHSRNDETIEGTFGTIVEDAQRRDLTINALYINISSGEYVDPTGLGLFDIENHIIRIPNTTDFNILRCIRFAVELGWEFSTEIIESIERNVGNLADIENKKLLKDIYGIVKLDNKEHALHLMEELGVFPYVKSMLKQAEIMVNCEVPNEPILYYNRRKDLILKKSILLPLGKEYAVKIKDRTNATEEDIIKTLYSNEVLDQEQIHEVFMFLAKVSDSILLKTTRTILKKNMLPIIERIGAMKYVATAIAKIECDNNLCLQNTNNNSRTQRYMCVLRSIRLAIERRLEIGPEIMDILNKNVPALIQVKKQLIDKEVNAIFALDDKERALRLLKQVGAMEYIASCLAIISTTGKKHRKNRQGKTTSVSTCNIQNSFDSMNVLQRIKLAVRLGWGICSETIKELKNNVGKIAELNHCALLKEVQAILALDDKERAFRLLEQVGAMVFINPIIAELNQNNKLSVPQKGKKRSIRHCA